MSTTRDALALHAAGRTADALVLLFDAVGAAAGAPDGTRAAEHRQLLAQLLEGVSLDSGNAVIHRVLRELLGDHAVDVQQVARAALGLVMASPEFAALEAWSSVPDEGIEDARLAAALKAWLQLPLVPALLPRVVLSDARVERVVTFARRALLALLSRDGVQEAWHWEAVQLLAREIGRAHV